MAKMTLERKSQISVKTLSNIKGSSVAKKFGHVGCSFSVCSSVFPLSCQGWQLLWYGFGEFDLKFQIQMTTTVMIHHSVFSFLRVLYFKSLCDNYDVT